jgi:hypothetical protein
MKTLLRPYADESHWCNLWAQLDAAGRRANDEPAAWPNHLDKRQRTQ